MKKNKMMRLASAMMVTTLMTTSVISGTFAKYTTQDSGSDVARVAKWGVELQVVGDLYGSKYLPTTQNIATASGTDISVHGKADASTDENVVAPGTKSVDGFSFFLKGTPEVDSKVTVKVATQNIYLTEGEYGVMVQVPAGKVTEANYAELHDTVNPGANKNKLLFVSSDAGQTFTLAGATFDDSETYYTLEDYVNLTDAYYPVVYALNGNTSTIGSTATDSLGEAANAILTAVYGATTTVDEKVADLIYAKEISQVYDVNTDLATKLKLDDTYLTWAWEFEEDVKEGDSASMTDKADTILGNLIAGTVKVVKFDGTYTYEAATKVVETVTDPATTGYSTYAYATIGTDVIASLTTQFNIDITVTQVD